MVDSEPVAVALKFGFLAVLFLFLLWVSRSAVRELRAAGSTGGAGAGLPGAKGRVAATDAFLVTVSGGGLQVGSRYDLFGGVSIGRSDQADIQIEDRYASGIHARVHSRGPLYYVEDMGSTNGTFLNGSKLEGETSLSDLDEIRIGDTEWRFELDVPDGA